MKKYTPIVVAILVLGLAQIGMAQPPLSASATTDIYATKAESLTISVTAFPTDFLIDAGGAQSTAIQSLSITTSWTLKPQRASVDVCATGTDLLASDLSNTDIIPVADVQADAGSGFAAINAAANCGQTAATLVRSHALATDGWKNITKTDTVDIRLFGLDPALQADRYHGTITVYAYTL